MNSKIKHLLVSSDISILSAMKLMDEIRSKLLIVTKDEAYLGLLSIGDIQRAIINNFPLTTAVASIMRNEYIVANTSQSIEEIKALMLRIRAEFMPVVNEKRELVKVYFWEELFDKEDITSVHQFQLPVVIMAGGFGTRMKPLTNVLPKPLIPIGDKSMLEEIFDRFGKYGCNNFYLSVNYKAELIEHYLLNQNLPYQLNFFKEESPMGTAGSLSLLKGKIQTTFFVSNCDILIDQNYSEILSYHKENYNEITLVAALKHYPIPYGTVKTGKNGQLLELKEKPELTFKINSGIYVLEPHLLNEIPENTFFHITHLIEKIISRKGNVGVFPVSEGSWVDIGSMEDYLKIITK